MCNSCSNVTCAATPTFEYHMRNLDNVTHGDEVQITVTAIGAANGVSVSSTGPVIKIDNTPPIVSWAYDVLPAWSSSDPAAVYNRSVVAD